MKTCHIIINIVATIFFISLLFSTMVFPQQTGILEYQYLSPVPGSGMNSPKTNIIIRYGMAYKTADVFSKDVLKVTGNKSGFHSGRITLAENNRTILFDPELPFQEGETVTVKLLEPVRTEDDKFIPSLNFNFRITEHDLTNLVKNNPEKYLFREYSELLNTNKTPGIKPGSDSQVYSVMDDSLPADFPHIEVDSLNDPSPGYIFLAPFYYFNFTGNNYLTIVNNYGLPVFYRKIPSLLFDFKKQPGDILTYYQLSVNRFYVLDSSYSIIDSLYTQNGYLTDLHELLILENNHSLMMSYDFQHVAMDTVVPGGDPDAIVEGLIIQEQDENKNVVFQWRSWDHFQITDATYDIDLTDSLIDYAHGNAIDVDSDGNLLISCRHMDEVTKISRQTGDIIWRMGGEYCKNNQFTFINDPIGFSHQHDVRRLENGNLTVFDNGNLHSPLFTRIAEYQLDEINKLAFLVWEYSNDPLSFSIAMGDARRLPNHNTFIGWGTGTSPAISEVKPNGDVALFLTIPDTLINYRGFKFPWKTNLFVSDPDSLVFGYIPLGDSLELPLQITNNSDHQIEINGVYNRESVYTINEALPIIILPFGSESITVKFKPEITTDYLDDLHLRWDTEGQRIAQVVPLIGSADPNSSSETESKIQDYNLSQNYPNPFNPFTTIRYQIPTTEIVSLKIYDILGRDIASLVNEEKPAGSYKIEFDATSLPSGIYFYTLTAGKFRETKKMVLVK
jgi:hypothetical protein